MNILIVDDEPVIRNGAQFILKKQGHSTVLSEDAESAIQIVEQQFFDLVIIDYLLPGVNGLELVNIIKKNSPRTIIILISGFITEKTIVSGFSAGIFDFLPKPFTKAELLSCISRAEKRIKLDITPFLEQGSSRLFFGEHSWVEKGRENIRKIGVDVRLSKTFNVIESVHVKHNETVLQQGGLFFTVSADGNATQVLAPVAGVIHAWNPKFEKYFRRFFEDPFSDDHWIAEVRLTQEEENLKALHEFERG